MKQLLCFLILKLQMTVSILQGSCENLMTELIQIAKEKCLTCKECCTVTSYYHVRFQVSYLTWIPTVIVRFSY